MFDPSPAARVFQVPLGVHYGRAVVSGLLARCADRPPEDLARIQMIVGTNRMARQIRSIFDEGPARLLPKINLLTHLGDAWTLPDLPEAVSPLRRRLELISLVSALIERQPDLAPRSSLYDLADSLARLMDEMRSEGVAPESILELDVSDQSGHWARSKAFLEIVQTYFGSHDQPPDLEARRRMAIESLIASWDAEPPEHPVIIVGSTGSRERTQMLIRAVANLPQGAVILPGFDTDMPEDAWEMLDRPMLSEDHPQYRFAQLMQQLDLEPQDVRPWTDDSPADAARSRIVSLALRPAPVTDQWLRDGPSLSGIVEATSGVTLIEAPSTRVEAVAIAMRLRQAAADGRSATLVTPDQALVRQVSAALERWEIRPDIASHRLDHSPVGRFLRHIAELFAGPVSAELLLSVLKHPVAHSGGDRRMHLRHARMLERRLRRHGPPYPTAESLREWAEDAGERIDAAWVEWLAECVLGRERPGDMPLAKRIEQHLDLAERIACGHDGRDAGILWKREAGREAREAFHALAGCAEHCCDLNARDYESLFQAILSRALTRNDRPTHPHVLVRGIRETRSRESDLLILAGLNEGQWPQTNPADPWLNRAMRDEVGLVLPERQTGLSAHDFQQGILAPEVWLTRSIRSDDAETVPSRWLNRLRNLLEGLPEREGPAALEGMRGRGERWLRLAEALEEPIQAPRARRPSPRPPAEQRPKRLSVTQIQRLIRDPYEIYARKVLNLNPLDPLMRTPDALLRGQTLHEALEAFIQSVMDGESPVSSEALVQTVGDILERRVPWAMARVMWRSRIERIADRFVQHESLRRERARPRLLEAKGEAVLPGLDFTLSAKADRIDIEESGDARMYDYKTGAAPSPKQQRHFDKQLQLVAAIAQEGGFENLDPVRTSRAAYVSLSPSAAQHETDAEIEYGEDGRNLAWSQLGELISKYMDPGLGYTSRRAAYKSAERGDYDQLARFGEWDETDDPAPEEMP